MKSLLPVFFRLFLSVLLFFVFLGFSKNISYAADCVNTFTTGDACLRNSEYCTCIDDFIDNNTRCVRHVNTGVACNNAGYQSHYVKIQYWTCDFGDHSPCGGSMYWINGVVLADDTGTQRWTKDPLGCNPTYTGVNIATSASNSQVTWGCPEVAFGILPGNIDDNITLSPASGYSCNTWKIKKYSDNSFVNSGTGCTATLNQSVTGDWQYGIEFNMKRNYVAGTTPTVSLTSQCINSATTTSVGTLSWTNGTNPVTYIDISTDPNFGSWVYKAVTGTSTSFPDGFSGDFTIQPNTTYYARTWDGTSHSLNVQINPIPLCQCRIQGRHIIDPVSYSGQTLNYTQLPVSVPIYLNGSTTAYTSANPYFINNLPGNSENTVRVQPPSTGYKLEGWTRCFGSTLCHLDALAQGATATIYSCPAGSYVDLYWHYSKILPGNPSTSVNTSCINGTITTGNVVNISWTNTADTVRKVRISSTSSFGTYMEKLVTSGTTSTYAPNGFSSGLSPDINYYVRTVDVDGDYSAQTATFIIPRCTGLTLPTITSVPSCVSPSNSYQIRFNLGSYISNVWVDVDNDSNWANGYYRKAVPIGTITDFPSGFNGYAGLSGALTITSGTTYYARVYGENNTTGGSAFSQVSTIPYCSVANPVPTCVISPPSNTIYAGAKSNHTFTAADNESYVTYTKSINYPSATITAPTTGSIATSTSALPFELNSNTVPVGSAITLRVTVTDTQGASGFCIATVNVVAPPVNNPPTCIKPTLSEYLTYGVVGYPLNYPITVTGGGTDPEGTPVTYRWSTPSVGTISNLSANPTTYTTSRVYSVSEDELNYVVTDQTGLSTSCPYADEIRTMAFPGVSTSWYNYTLDLNKVLSDTKSFSWTQSNTSVGYNINTAFSIDKTTAIVNGKPNICKEPGVTCTFANGTSSISETVPATAVSTTKSYPATITVSFPTSLSIGTYYGIRISGANTYRGATSPFANEKLVAIGASTSTIAITCNDGSTGTCYTLTLNRGASSGNLAYKLKSNGFTGNVTISKDSIGICGRSDVTCTFSQNGTSFANTQTVALTSGGSKTIYIKVQTSYTTPAGNYSTKIKANGIRAVVGTSTGDVYSPQTVITLLNVVPSCGLKTYSYSPSSSVVPRSTVRITVGGGTDAEGDLLTYKDWAVTSANSITAVSADSANIITNTTFGSCTEVRYKVYDSNGASSALCTVPETLCNLTDTTPPTATISASAGICKGADYTINATASDNDSLGIFSIYRKNPVSQIATKTGSFGKSTTLSGTATFGTAGTYYVYPVVTDSSGNTCDSSGSVSCGPNTYKTVTVNENVSAPQMSYLTYSSDPTKVRITFTKDSAVSASNYSLTGSGTIGTITCSTNSCGADITGLTCSSNYSYTLTESDANSCSGSSTISNVSPNCAPTCKAPAVVNPPTTGIYPLNTSYSINSTKDGSTFDSEDADSVTHVWVPSLSGTGLGGITAGGATATYLTPSRNNITTIVSHYVRDNGGAFDSNSITKYCGAVSFPMESDGLANYRFNPSPITISRTVAIPTGTSNFLYDLSNYQPGTFSVDTTNSNNSNFIGNNICAFTSLLTCSWTGSAPVGTNKSVPLTITFKSGARQNFDATKAYKAKGTLSYTTTNASGVTQNKSASAYLDVNVSNTAPTCTISSRLSTTSAWTDVTNKYITYAKGTKVYLNVTAVDADTDTIGSYSWSTTAGSISPSNVASTSYTTLNVDGLYAEIVAKATESSPNSLFGSCATIVRTPSPGVHTLSNGSISRLNPSTTITYSYRGYENVNNGVGVNGIATISSSAIAGYINICTLSGATCKFSNGTGSLSIASGANSSESITVTVNPNTIDNTKLYAVKVNFSAPTTGGGTINASASGGVINLLDTAPSCGSIVLSPREVHSGSGSNVQITASASDDWKMANVKLKYNTDITGTNSGTWTQIGTTSTFTNTLNSTAVFNWDPTALPLGKYLVQAAWTDNANPANSTVCSGLSSLIANDPTSPTDTNNATVVVSGNRFSGRILVQHDNWFYKPVRKDRVGGTEFVITSDLGSTSWKGTNITNCIASFPDGSADSDNCSDYFVSDSSFSSGQSTTAEVFVPATYNNPKYTCTWDIINRTILGVRTIVASGSGCTTSSFVVEAGDTSYTASTKWTTEVDFYLTYNTDQVSGKVLDLNAAGQGGYTITANGISGSVVSSPSGLFYAFPNSLDSKDYLPAGNRVFTLTGDITDIGTAASPNKCFYAFNSNGVDKNFSPSEVASIAKGGTIAGWTIGEGVGTSCKTANLPITHGVLSPKYQNRLYFFIVPKITVNPASSLKIVDNCVNKKVIGSENPPSFTPTIDLYFPSSATTPPIGSAGYKSSDGTFSIYNLPTSSAVNTELKWGQTYQAVLAVAADYNVCDNRTPSFVVQSSDPSLDNVDSGLNQYPAVNSDKNQVKFNFYATLKNSNDWWQVYNGGVHANGELNVSRLPTTALGGGMSLIGNGLLSPIVSAYYSPALVSSSDQTSIIGLGSGTAGLLLPLPSYNWSAEKMTSEMKSPYGSEFFDKVTASSSGWTDKSSKTVKKVLEESDPAYIDTSSGTLTLGASTNKHTRPIVLIIDGGTGTLNITGDVTSDLGETVVLIVNGNVSIDYSVTNIYATIYATGSITVKTKGDETDPILHVYGNLYASSFNFQRDLANIPTNIGVPAEKIIYEPRLIGNSNNYPSAMKQVNTFWIVRD